MSISCSFFCNLFFTLRLTQVAQLDHVSDDTKMSHDSPSVTRVYQYAP